jgi:hypothetical protein
MKKINLAIAIGGVILGGTALVLASTNPSSQQYEDYAIEYIGLFLQENACQQLPASLEFFKTNCQSLIQSLVDIGNPTLRQLISQNTTHHNYILFSIFKTDLSLSSPLPTPNYHFETIAIFQNFYVFQVDQEAN